MSHRIHTDLHEGHKEIADPGDAGEIRVSHDFAICEMVSGVALETRTLINPTKPGIHLHLRMLTDGGGDIRVYASEGLDVQEEISATFGDAGDFLDLVSVTKTAGEPASTGVYRWQQHPANFGVTLA